MSDSIRARVRVLIADDSATVRGALAALLAEDPSLRVVGEASDGLQAVQLARALRPDVVTMDVNMPRLDGLGATAAIMAEAPARVLVICAVSEERQLDLSFRAIAAGALELIAKPGAGSDELRRFGRRVCEAVRLMAEVPVIRRQRLPGASAVRPSAPGSIDALGIVASTGGPPALAAILAALPGDLRMPLLVAQHIATGFTEGLRRWLAGVSKLPVRIARSGQACEGGAVWLPPDGCDLLRDTRGRLITPLAAGPHSPSGNRLLASLARGLGSRAGGVVLTGMGDDGAQGLLAIRQAGGPTYAQDEGTSVVFGMPQAAHALGATKNLVALELIAPLIVELA